MRKKGRTAVSILLTGLLFASLPADPASAWDDPVAQLTEITPELDQFYAKYGYTSAAADNAGSILEGYEIYLKSDPSFQEQINAVWQYKQNPSESLRLLAYDAVDCINHNKELSDEDRQTLRVWAQTLRELDEDLPEITEKPLEEAPRPENPDDSGQPSLPVDPERPVRPGDPDQPEEPANPDPEEPGNPDEPDNPDEPENPENPGNPDDPSQGDGDGDEDQDENLPGFPEEPGEPGVDPERPVKPSDPAKPEGPDNSGGNSGSGDVKPGQNEKPDQGDLFNPGTNVKDPSIPFNPSDARPNYTTLTVKALSKTQNRKITINGLGTFNILPDYTNSLAWKGSISPYNTPSLWGQCTWFAWGRFYELYGFSPQFSGNGYQCVEQLLAAHPDKFRLSSLPAAGAVFSSDAAHNHVGIVLEYDAASRVLTIQEGNLDGVSNADWEIAKDDYRTIKVTVDDMRTMYGNVTYAVPKAGTKMLEYKGMASAASSRFKQVKTLRGRAEDLLKASEIRSSQTDEVEPIRNEAIAKDSHSSDASEKQDSAQEKKDDVVYTELK